MQYKCDSTLSRNGLKIWERSRPITKKFGSHICNDSQLNILITLKIRNLTYQIKITKLPIYNFVSQYHQLQVYQQVMKNYKQEHVHASFAFGISIFQCAQQMIALNISLFKSTEESTTYLNRILKRTKSPPISALYTFQFLKSTDQAQTQLSIIRFISQLSDLSVGKSMQSSLSFLENGSFLTELRHNLTHRVMLKGVVIQKGRQMILKQLSQKYWNQITQKIWNFNVINHEKVEEYYKKIYKNDLAKQAQIQNKLYFRYLDNLQTQQKNIQNMKFLQGFSNYKYKQAIQLVLKGCLNSAQDKQIKNLSLEDLIPQNSFKVTIFACVLTDLTLKLRTKKCFQFLQKLIEYLKQNQIQVLKQKLVLKKIRKFYFFNYLSQFQRIIKILPQEVKTQIIKFWSQKKVKFNKDVLFKAESL